MNPLSESHSDTNLFLNDEELNDVTDTDLLEAFETVDTIKNDCMQKIYLNSHSKSSNSALSKDAIDTEKDKLTDKLSTDKINNSDLFDFFKTHSKAQNCAQSSTSSSQNDYEGFDKEAGKIWIYPTNLPIRSYQINIVQKALFNNTLVCLPTGLGKTFVAAVVMYNFYRWYPSGKVIFMAPTKPLVIQQVKACQQIMAIPAEHIAEMTGCWW